MIIVNFKTYREATDYHAVELARLCRRIQDETGVRIIAVPQIADLRNCVETGSECWVQHIDSAEQGKMTGWITLEDVEQVGARGTLLNHSEHKLPYEKIKELGDKIRGMAFELCICVSDLEEAKKMVEIKPDYVAYEPVELIGNREKSVASEKPEEIQRIVNSVEGIVLVGAGVHSAEDVKIALKLGARGVLLATDVVLARDPEKELMELARAFK